MEPAQVECLKGSSVKTLNCIIRLLFGTSEGLNANAKGLYSMCGNQTKGKMSRLKSQTRL